MGIPITKIYTRVSRGLCALKTAAGLDEAAFEVVFGFGVDAMTLTTDVELSTRAAASAAARAPPDGLPDRT